MPHKDKEAERAYRRALYARNPSAQMRRAKKYLAWKVKQEPDIHRWRAIWYTYGLTKDAWLGMFEAQHRGCKVCGSSDPRSKKGWHTHHTGTKEAGNLQVHGILCHACNVILHNKATPKRLRDLADFVESYDA